MAWETRRNGRYYYKKRRIGRRVVSTYQGAGRLAGIAADLQAIRTARAADWRQQDAAERAAWPADDPALDDLATLLTGLTHAVLLLNGYHTHHRTWRKRRAHPQTATRAAPGA